MSAAPHAKLSHPKKITTHVLVCQHKTCVRQGAKGSLRELKRALKDAGSREEVLITKVKCLDQCGRGPVMVVYPEGVWYGGVGKTCARAIAERRAGAGEGGGGDAACGVLLRDLGRGGAGGAA